MKKVSAFSRVVKPAKNILTYSDAGRYNARYVGKYGTCTHKTAKLSYDGKKLKVTAYVYNNRIFKLKKIKISYLLVVDGKKFKKTITKSVNIGQYGKKKITYYIGSGVKDLRNGMSYKYVYSYGNWGFGWE